MSESLDIQADAPVTDDATLARILGAITFDKSVLDFGWRFRFKPIYVLDVERCGDRATADGGPRFGWLVWGEFTRPDIHTGETGVGRGRDELVWRGTTLSGVVKTCWTIFDTIVRHEKLEGFRFAGVQVFNPHYTVAQLMSPAATAPRREDTYQLSGSGK